MTHALSTEPIVSVAIDVIPADACVGAEGERLADRPARRTAICICWPALRTR